MAAAGIPAGYLRKSFGFFQLPDFNLRLWQKVKKSADAHIQTIPSGLLAGSDHDQRAVKAAKNNLRMLPGAQSVQVSRKAFQELEGLENHIIVCNPPYGIRLNAPQQLGIFYKELGDFLKQRCQGSTAYLYFGKREMIKSIGLRPTWKKPLKNGGLDGRLVKYELY